MTRRQGCNQSEVERKREGEREASDSICTAYPYSAPINYTTPPHTPLRSASEGSVPVRTYTLITIAQLVMPPPQTLAPTVSNSK